jgi:hypothetical protein
MKVGLLTLEQKNEIDGKEFAPDSYFNPIQDSNDNWVISTEEMEQATIPTYQWVKNLPLIEFKPKNINLDNGK